MTAKIQVRTPGTQWATYDEAEGRAVAQAFRDMGIPVETREPPKSGGQEKGNG